MKIEKWVDGIAIRDRRLIYGDIVGFDESEQRELVVWFCENKPELLRDVIGVKDILDTLEKQRAKAEQDYRIATEPNEKQYKKSRNNTLCSVIDYLRKALP